MSSITQFTACLILTAYLAPCAWQDWRTRKVSNWLTVPAFVAAWPVALWFGNLGWTVAVFLGCYVAWQFKGMGAADGKLATLMAAIHPILLINSVGLLVFGFLIVRILAKSARSLPASVFLFMATFCFAVHIIIKM